MYSYIWKPPDFLEYVTMISWCNLHKFEEENY